MAQRMDENLALNLAFREIGLWMYAAVPPSG